MTQAVQPGSLTVGPDKVGATPVAVLILNWNGWADTLECLESVLKLDYPSFRILVCDNGSTDGSVDRILDWAAGRLDAVPERREMAAYANPPVPKPIAVVKIDRADVGDAARDEAGDAPLVLIRNGANLGFGAGNNVGLRYALARGFDLIWLLNADTVVAPGSLSALVARIQGDPAIGLCGSLLCHYDAPALIEEAGGCAYYPLLGIARRIERDAPIAHVDPAMTERRLGYVSGASCLVRSDFVRDVGPMTEEHFLYGEEIDWALRAKGRYRLGFAPGSVVYHKKGRATGSDSYSVARSPSSAFHLWRARVRVARRHHPLALPMLHLLAAASAGSAWLRGDASMARMIMRGLRDANSPVNASQLPEPPA